MHLSCTAVTPARNKQDAEGKIAQFDMNAERIVYLPNILKFHCNLKSLPFKQGYPSTNAAC